MKSLLSKSMLWFTLSTVSILLICSPLFFLMMKYFYIEDLDELIIYRSNEFIEDQLTSFTEDEVAYWNKYNEDMQILTATEDNTINIKNDQHVVQKPFYNKAEGHEVDYRVYYTPILVKQKPYVLMSRIAIIEDIDLIRILVGQYVMLLGILLVCVIFIQQILSKKLWKPFYKSMQKVENFDINIGNTPHFEETNIKEFDRLNTILTNLIENNQRAYNQQKEFIQNASHELQTPLAVFQSKLDVFFQEPNLTEEQVKTIQSLYDILSRLTRLNKNLLLLARLENNQFRNIEDIDFQILLQKQLDYLSILAEADNITVIVDIKDKIHLKANRTLLETLVNNLVVNAIRHNINTEDARINIFVENNSLIVENTGERKSLDSEKIFKRFSRTTENKKGNGLGLSIVDQICKVQNWQLSYQYKNNLHVFIVKFI